MSFSINTKVKGPIRYRLMCFWDTETTGLSTSEDRVVQIAAVCSHAYFDTQVSPEQLIYREDEPRTFNKFVFTPRKINCMASKVTGIFNKDLLESPPLGEVLLDMAKFLHTLRREHKSQDETVMVAHNGRSFDVPMLMHSALNSHVNAELLLRSVGVTAVMDSLLVSRRVNPGFKSHRLGTLYEHYFNRTMNGAHDALADCEGLRDVFFNLKTNYHLDKQSISTAFGNARKAHTARQEKQLAEAIKKNKKKKATVEKKKNTKTSSASETSHSKKKKRKNRKKSGSPIAVSNKKKKSKLDDLSRFAFRPEEHRRRKRKKMRLL